MTTERRLPAAPRRSNGHQYPSETPCVANPRILKGPAARVHELLKAWPHPLASLDAGTTPEVKRC
jgi:hypothetical protein